MKRLRGVFHLSYRWKRAKGNGSILDRHVGYLEDEAWVKAKADMGRGKSSGPLSLNIKVDVKDGPDGVSYVGSWSIEKPAEAIARGEDS